MEARATFKKILRKEQAGLDCLANSAAGAVADIVQSHRIAVVYTVANEKADNWIQVSPFGDFPNVGGMQRVRKEDGDALVNDFNDPLNLEARTLGLPFYEGHPDFPAFESKHTDRKAKGRIKDLKVVYAANCAKCNAMDVDDPCHSHGIFANVRWNSEGRKLIEDEAYGGHSVNWRIRRDNGVVRPTSIKSIGFTNDPQIPVKPITTANEGQNMDKPTTLLGWIAKLLGKPQLKEEEAVNEMDEFYNSKLKPMMDRDAGCVKNDTDAKALIPGFTWPAGQPIVLVLANELVAAKGRETTIVNEKTTATGEVTRLGAEVTKLTGEKDGLANEKVTLTTRATTAETALANERKEHATLICANARKEGRITAAEEPTFVNEAIADLAATKTKLAGRQTSYVTTSRAGNLGGRRPEQIANQRERQDKVLELVNERMKAKSVSYDVAFAQIQRENPALFEQMTQPAAK